MFFIRGEERRVIEGAGHWVTYEAPAAVRSTLRDMLRLDSPTANS
jgi:pimeloyl-ACP methyl ester carboxylesterase